MEFNNENLLVLAKKITNQKFSLPKNISFKTNHLPLSSILYKAYSKENNNISRKDFIVNESQENINYPIKKGIKFKNKFLEENNIQINEEKMRHLLSERKRRMKFALSHGNTKTNQYLNNNKIIYINLDKPGNKLFNYTQARNSCETHNNYRKIIKYNTKFEKNSTFNDNYNYSYINGNIQNEPKKSLFNSNSDYFNNNLNSLNKPFISDRKSTKIIDKNIHLNITRSFTNNNSFLTNKISNYSRNEEYNNNNYFYSNKKIQNNNFDEVNEDINNNIKTNKNSINNNININININGNINNRNLNNIKKIENKKLKKRKKSCNRLYQPKKLISYRQNAANYKTEINDNINNFTDYQSFNEENKEKDNNIISTTEKKMKKYESHKIYYLKDITKNDEDVADDKEINDNKEIINDEEYNNVNKKNRREMTYEGSDRNILKYMDYNTYNVNVNVISDQKKDDASNIGYRNNENNLRFYNSNNCVKYKPYIQNRPNSIIPKNEIFLNNDANNNIGYFESPGNNNIIYSSQKLKKEKNLTRNKIPPKKLESISKKIEKKIYKNKEVLNSINNNNKILINTQKTQINYQNQNNNSKKINQPQNNAIKDNKKDNIIEIEDLLIIEGKFCHLLECLKYENPVPKICVEWWNFYTYSSFFGKFPKLFPKAQKDKNNNNYILSDYQIAHDSVMFELLTMIIIYKILCNSQKNPNLMNNLTKLLNEVHQNFLIECDYILSKVSIQSMSNLWVKKLKDLILSKRNWDDYNSQLNNFHLNLLRQGNNKIQNLIQNLINTYSKIYSNSNTNKNLLTSLTYYNKNISKIRLMELSGYFNKEISRENSKINRAFSFIIKKNINNNKSKYISIVVPYLPEEIENKKKYTLVLDLDETLISFRFGENHRGILKMRPGLFDFLRNVKKKYEIIIFTAGTQEYADPILDTIEKRGKFFAKRLYRQHTILMNKVYLKDLTRLGRDLSKIIIVDNMPQNFSLQKENGILIKNFFGEEQYETTLKDLSNILLKIASKPNNDVRKELKKYREEIFTKITTNL